jgi:hypothetical protein
MKLPNHKLEKIKKPQVSSQLQVSIRPKVSSGPTTTSRLNRIVFAVTLLWLVTTLLLLLYRPGSANAVQPRKTSHSKLALVNQAAALASLIY